MEAQYFENAKEARAYKTRKIIKDILLYLVLTFFAVFTVIPFLWMILYSFKSLGEIQDLTVPATFLPKDWTNNFQIFFKNDYYIPIWRYMFNSILVGAVSTGLSLIVTILAAFAFARLSFRGKEVIFSLMLATMMIPGEMMIITNFTTVSRLGWLDTYTALIVPFISSVFYTFYLRQNFRQIPDELYYAAKVDGISDFRYLLKVMLPIAKPAITTITILSMIGSWNAYIWPRAVTSSKSMYLVTNGIMRMFQSEAGDTLTTNYKMAAMTLVSLPLLIAFIVFKKYIMRGVSRAGIKG
ncbi:MAG: carbohydrate ABC transporter permease [Acholeplasmatales bacterium]|nr:carbohydrate ABC transporter permease [Acholeplasmatales bacterium]